MSKQIYLFVSLTNSSQGFKDDSSGSLATDTNDDYSYDLIQLKMAKNLLGKIISIIQMNHQKETPKYNDRLKI